MARRRRKNKPIKHRLPAALSGPRTDVDKWEETLAKIFWFSSDPRPLRYSQVWSQHITLGQRRVPCWCCIACMYCRCDERRASKPRSGEEDGVVLDTLIRIQAVMI